MKEIMEISHWDYCIVGAGPSGLTLAYKLLQSGFKVLLIERDSRIGGLAKSHDYDGQVFDTGPKRFHTDDPIVVEFLDHIMKEDMLRIGRSTEVHFLGKYFNWPLKSSDLWRLPPGTGVKCVLDLLKERKVGDPQSFHNYIVSKYGETLYQTFFAPYTHKFLRWDTEDIHSDWASTGINRTVIDKRVKANTLLDLLKGVLLPDKVETEFLYPAKGGFGAFYEKLIKLCSAYENFSVILGDKIRALEEHGARFRGITQAGRSVSFGQLVWSGNLNDLMGVIEGTAPHMHYLNTIFYNIICRENGIGKHRAQWIYVSKGEGLVSRITCMKEFSKETCADGYYNVICELTDSQVRPVYLNQPDLYTDGILEELVHMSFIKSKKYVEDVKINPVVDTYPIYHRYYNEDFGKAAAAVRKFSRRIHLLGRCGAFWYNNSDHSIRFAIEMAKKLTGGRDDEFDYREYFGGVVARAASPVGT
jgi:protoporphyrinogen oxidase